MSNTIGTAYIQIEPSTKGLGEKIESVLSSDADKAGAKAGGNFTSAFGGALKGIATVVGGATAAATATVGKLVQDASAGFAQYQQLTGGVSTLFGTQEMSLAEYAKSVGKSVADATAQYNLLEAAQKTVMDNAANAYKTAGMSANDYMETVTSFSAALISSLEGDTLKAATASNVAITDMADNANKMGTPLESIKNAYQGFAKQNYTMLDNLKLGYGGTKTEMERLLADAQKLSGVEYNMDSLADVYDAIHVIQTNMGITGTTAKEAAGTIEGSAGSISAAWENLVTGMGTSGADMDSLINNFVESAITYVSNMSPVIEQALSGIGVLIEQLAPIIAERVPAMLGDMLPNLLSAATTLVSGLLAAVIAALPSMIPQVIQLVSDLGNMIIEQLPMLIDAAVQIILMLANGLASAAPTLIPTIVDTVILIVDTLVNNIELLIDAALALIIGLSEGLLAALPTLIAKVPEIIVAIVNALINAAPQLVRAAARLIGEFAVGIVGAIPQVLSAIVKLLAGIYTEFEHAVNKLVECGIALVLGLWEGIKKAWADLKANIKKLADDLVDYLAEIFKIGSPSKLMRDMIGRWLPPGIAVGIKATAEEPVKALSDMALKMKTQINADVTSGMLLNGGYKLADTDKSNNGMMELMRTLISELDHDTNINVTLEGDAAGIFRMVRSQNVDFKRSNGISAFA